MKNEKCWYIFYLENSVMDQIPECFYRVSAKALVLDETRTKFLLMREDNNMRDFPGGWLDFGEDPREGIIREFKEEAGIDVVWVDTKVSYFTTSYNSEHDIRIANILYQTKLKDIKITPSKECQEVRFVSKEEADKLNLRSNVTAFLKQFVVG